MSGKLMGAIFGLDLPHRQREVLLALADHAEDDGTGARPGVARLAWKTDLSEAQVQRHLQVLRRLGVIEAVAHAQGGRGHATEYVFHLERVRRKPEFQKGRIPTNSAAEVAASDPLKGRIPTPPITPNGRTQMRPFEQLERVASAAERVASAGAKGSHSYATPTVINPAGVPVQQQHAGERRGDGHDVALPHMAAMALPTPGQQGSDRQDRQTLAQDMVARVCRVVGDGASETTTRLNREMAIAVQLVDAGATPDEAEAWARDAVADPRRASLIDGLRTFEKERLGWLARSRDRAVGPLRVDRTGQPAAWELPELATAAVS